MSTYGEATKELRRAWDRRVPPGTMSTLGPGDAIQALFNDVDLFPSQSQVHEMVQCARECSNAASDSAATVRKNSITFGEFCVFATELKKYYAAHQREAAVKQQPSTPEKAMAPPSAPPDALRTQKSSVSSYDVFLGGSCNPTTWRHDVAIPHLKSEGITYYNPQQANWVPEMIELEHQAKQTSQILLFVMSDATRNIVSMIEVAYLAAGARRRLVVVINRYPGPGHTIGGEVMSHSEFGDLDRGLTSVHDIVEREGMPVFSDLKTALACTSKAVKEGIAIEDLGLQDRVQPVRLAHLQVGDKLVRLRKAFDTMDTAHCGYISLADARMAFRVHTNRDLSQRDLRHVATCHGNGDVTIDFDHFCRIVSEFKSRQTATGEAASSSQASSGPPSVTRPSKLPNFFHAVFRPFSKLANWIGCSRRERTRHSAAVAADSAVVTAQPPPSASTKTRRSSQVRDVYLGGTAVAEDDSGWREAVAIPMLKKCGLTYYKPSPSRDRRLAPLEAAAMDNSRALLFVVEGGCRGVSAMCEAAYCVGKRGGSGLVVLCVQKMPETADLTPSALKDFNRGRTYLSDFANREKVSVFEDIAEAVECILHKCKSLK